MKTPEETLRQWLDNKIVFNASLLPGYKRGVYTRAQMARISRVFTPTDTVLVDPLSPFNTNDLLRMAITKLGVLKTIDFFVTQNIIRYSGIDELFLRYLRVAGVAYDPHLEKTLKLNPGPQAALNLV